MFGFGAQVRPSKSKEELEKEKEDTLKQRTQSVNLDGALNLPVISPIPILYCVFNEQ